MKTQQEIASSIVTAGEEALVVARKMKADSKCTMRELQSRFALASALIPWKAAALGYEVTLGEGFDDDGKGHMKGSLHYEKLAQDLNLFIGGVYQTSTEAHKPLGEWWESIGGSWGGRFNDGNHYSFSFGGKK